MFSSFCKVIVAHCLWRIADLLSRILEIRRRRPCWCAVSTCGMHKKRTFGDAGPTPAISIHFLPTT